ncbi:MAG: BrnT family toxin [Chloroflexi bacterium]|nr:BrnT family toxin [Chloroflexota bacterium]
MDWDPFKDLANQRKHGVSFREAETVLDDPLVSIEEDRDHSLKEARYQATGTSGRERLLVVVIVALDDDTARIISARRPMKGERHDYEDRQA